MTVKMEMDKEQVEKPFNLTVVETKEAILKNISDAKLPASVVQMLLREITNAIDNQARIILDKEREEYNKRLKGVK